MDAKQTTVTVDGKAPWKMPTQCGGYTTNVRAICACGVRCECAGETRCNKCQDAALRKLGVRVGRR